MAVLVDSATKTVPAGGQLALLDSELFSIIKHEVEIGWIQVEGSPGIQAFAIGGDFVGTVDGGSPSAPATQQILPLLAGQVKVYGVNPNDSPLSVRVQAFDANGNDVGLLQAERSKRSGKRNVCRPTNRHNQWCQPRILSSALYVA